MLSVVQTHDVLIYILPELETNNLKLFLDALEQLDFLEDSPVGKIGDFNVPPFVDPSASDCCKLPLDGFVISF